MDFIQSVIPLLHTDLFLVYALFALFKFRVSTKESGFQAP